MFKQGVLDIEHCYLKARKKMYIKRDKTWGSFLEWVSGFDDEKLVEQIRTLEHIIDCDVAKECVLFDAVLDLYENLRDECVKRVAERM